MKQPQGVANSEQLRQARESNYLKQRQPHVWMGRDNEFRTQRRSENANVSKSVQNAVQMYSSAGANLRNANFAFGFEDNKR